MNLIVFYKDNLKIFCVFRFFENITFFQNISPNLIYYGSIIIYNLLWIYYYIYYYIYL